MEGVLNGLRHAVFALAVACGHDGHAAVLEHGADVAEVEVDDAVHGDDFGNGAGCDAQRVVGHFEGGEHGEVGVDFTQTFVVDDEQGVDLLGYFLDAVERLVDFLVTLEQEGDGDDAHGEDVHGLGLAGNDGSCTRAGAAAHAGCDEDHLGAVVEHLAYFLNALLGSLTGAFGTVAGTETFVAQLEPRLHGRVGECLGVGVAHHEVDVVNAFAVHVVHGIAAAAAHTDDFNNGGGGAGGAYVDEKILVVFRHDVGSLR